MIVPVFAMSLEPLIVLDEFAFTAPTALRSIASIRETEDFFSGFFVFLPLQVPDFLSCFYQSCLHQVCWWLPFLILLCFIR